MDEADVRYVRERLASRGISLPDDLPRGGIVGMATLVDCVQRIEIPWSRRTLGRLLGEARVPSSRQPIDSEWFEGPYGFVLQDARRLPSSPGAASRASLTSRTTSTGQSWRRDAPGKSSLYQPRTGLTPRP
jgi:hypothetical protein